MKKIGKLHQYPELEAICDAIFSRKDRFVHPDGTTLHTKRFREGKLYAVDYQGLRYVEQNPETHSAYAELARKGSSILWVMRIQEKVRDANGQEYMVPLRDHPFIGRVQDGQVYKK